MLHFAANSRHRQSPDLPPGWFAGIWEDVNGAVLELEVSRSELRGRYHVDFGRSGVREEFVVEGFLHEDLLAFAVDFGRHGSLAAFTGQAFSQDGRDGLHLIWLLTEKTASHSDEPDSVLTGSSDFLRRADA